MPLGDFSGFDVFSEPVVVVKSNNSIFYMNDSAKALYGESYMKADATSIFGRHLLSGRSPIITASFTFKRRTYMATVMYINNYRAIVTRMTSNTEKLKEELGRIYMEPILGVFRSASENIQSIINSIRLKRYDISKETLRTDTAIFDHSNSAVTRLLNHLEFLTGDAENIGSGIELFDICEAVSEVTTVASTFAAHSGHMILYRSEVSDVVFKGDKKLISMVVLNLISNSIKHTSRGGRIEVSLDELENGDVEIVVADSGEGIPAGKQHMLFEPFTVRDKSEYFECAGLGLSVVKKISDMYNGSVTVESTKTGTTVRVALHTLPCDETILREPRPNLFDATRIVFIELSDAVDIRDYIDQFHPHLPQKKE